MLTFSLDAHLTLSSRIVTSGIVFYTHTLLNTPTHNTLKMCHNTTTTLNYPNRINVTETDEIENTRRTLQHHVTYNPSCDINVCNDSS